MPPQGRNTRILLLGATGQIGRELLGPLERIGQVIAVAHRHAAQLSEADALRVELTDPDAVRSLVRDVSPTLIVNAAAYTDVDQAEDDAPRAEAVNARAPAELAAAARRLGAGLVHFSTDYVFNGEGDTPWRETDLPQPLNVYGQTKWAGEQAIQAAGVAHLILRTSWLYGLGGRNFVRRMLELGQVRDELAVVSDQIGAPTPARTVAQSTAAILAQGRTDLVGLLQRRGGTYHLCCSGETSWCGLAEEVFRLAREVGYPLRIHSVMAVATADYPRAARRPLNSRLDCHRLMREFGIQLPSWHQALSAIFPEILAAESYARQAV